MTKPWLLILLGVFLTGLLGLWLFLFLGGDEAREDLFATFGLGEIIGDFPADTTTTPDGEGGVLPILRQLSFRPVIGYQEVSTSTNRTVYLTEAGTGHIYRVTAATGAEERVSNHTVAMASEAVFSADGNRVAILSNDQSKGITLITKIGSASSSVTTISASPISVGFLANGSFVYAVRDNQETVGYLYGEKTTELFRVPFRETHLIWGQVADGPHLVYPKTSSTLEGYLYSIQKGRLSRLPLSGFGLSVATNNDASEMLYFRKQGGNFESIIYQAGSGSRVATAVTALPEKCVFATHTPAILCAVPQNNSRYSTSFPDSWYEGSEQSVDSLWSISTEFSDSQLVFDLGQSGRSIDAMKLMVSQDGQASYFINRIDNSLWIFDRDFTVPIADNQ